MFVYRLLAVPPTEQELESAPRSIVQKGDILNTERNAARVLSCESEGRKKGVMAMSDSVDGRGRSEFAAQTRQEVVLFLVRGKPEEVDAFAKRADSGCLEPHDNKMVINMDLVSRSELDELLKTVPLQLSEQMGRRLSVDCCESLMRRRENNYRICPKFYNLIAEHKIGDIRIVGSIIIAKSSAKLREWQRAKLKAEGRDEESRSKIPIGL